MNTTTTMTTTYSAEQSNSVYETLKNRARVVATVDPVDNEITYRAKTVNLNKAQFPSKESWECYSIYLKELYIAVVEWQVARDGDDTAVTAKAKDRAIKALDTVYNVLADVAETEIRPANVKDIRYIAVHLSKRDVTIVSNTDNDGNIVDGSHADIRSSFKAWTAIRPLVEDCAYFNLNGKTTPNPTVSQSYEKLVKAIAEKKNA